MDNKEWGHKLREACLARLHDLHEDETPGPSGIRLPAGDQIAFEGEMSCVKVTMSEEAVVANMQTNAAAFEAWSLALRVWCGVTAVELNWARPSNISPTKACHYQRFLFRAERFGALCADWFRVADPALLSDAKTLGAGPFVLNVPGDRSPSEEPNDTRDKSASGRESDTEKRLVGSEQFRNHFGLRKEKIDRQFPVGLFRNCVSRENRIFTGGKSAIDLVGVGDGGRALSLFELKTGRNISAGILSELLFYASVIRYAIPVSSEPALFQFGGRKSKRDQRVSAEDVMRCASINAVLLADRFHPLVGHPDIVEQLNKSAEKHWNGERGCVPVSFRAVLLKRLPNSLGEFDFADVAP